MITRWKSIYIQLNSLISSSKQKVSSQQLFQQFFEEFNQIDSNYRFDSDCIAELHLRNLELNEFLNQQNKLIYNEGNELISTILNDGSLVLLVHRVYSEGISLIQAQLHRFHMVLHILFDYSKAFMPFNQQNKFENELEVCLPLNNMDLLNDFNAKYVNFNSGANVVATKGKGKNNNSSSSVANKDLSTGTTSVNDEKHSSKAIKGNISSSKPLTNAAQPLLAPYREAIQESIISQEMLQNIPKSVILIEETQQALQDEKK